MKYPTDRKGRHWSHRVVRLLMKTCASHAIGSHGVNLVVCIAHTEDAKHYSDHVTYFNDDLQRVLGLRKWDTLAKARSACVDTGWLHYEAGGTHKAGIYWSLIPPEFAQIDDLPTDEGLSGEDLQRQSYAAGYRDGKAGRPMLYPGNGDNRGDNHGDNSGDNHGDNRGEHSTLSLTLRESEQNRPDATPQKNGKPKGKRTLKFDPVDQALSEELLGLIRKLNPECLTPPMAKWSQEFRLMRERDRRTPERIRQVMQAAHAHDFWQTNILSPFKLRKQFDTVVSQLKLTRPAARKQMELPPQNPG